MCTLKLPLLCGKHVAAPQWKGLVSSLEPTRSLAPLTKHSVVAFRRLTLCGGAHNHCQWPLPTRHSERRAARERERLSNVPQSQHTLHYFGLCCCHLSFCITTAVPRQHAPGRFTDAHPANMPQPVPPLLEGESRAPEPGSPSSITDADLRRTSASRRPTSSSRTTPPRARHCAGVLSMERIPCFLHKTAHAGERSSSLSASPFLSTTKAMASTSDLHPGPLHDSHGARLHDVEVLRPVPSA